MNASAIVVHEHGGPEVLCVEDVAVPEPGPGEIRVRSTAVGLNFIDTYHRSGLYPLPLPLTLGLEGAGVVTDVGEGVADLAVGDRVGYCLPPTGAYASARVLPARIAVPLPDDVPDDVAAAALLKGLTAQYLLRQTHRVQAGEAVLIHAAAGGMGLILCQWAKHLGATVIGTVSTDAKAALAAAHGCDYPVRYDVEDVPTRVRELTGGAGVPVVYDGVGAATFEASLDCLAPRGLMVSFGNASGAVPPFAPAKLAQKGSLYLTRPTLMTYAARREDLLAMAAELFAALDDGGVSIEIGQRWPLAEAAAAHRALEARRTTGSTLLIPG